MVRGMSESELEQALRPVRDHFFGANVTLNTVLSAHLRASGLHPSGETWSMAKTAMDEGASFEEAVATAGGPEPRVNGAETGHQAGSAPAAGSPASSGPAATPPGQSTQRSSDVVYQEVPAIDLRAPTHARPQAPPLDGDEGLEWFPKRYGVGDIDGEGASKLLGTPNLAPVSVLVRETAQNSWDARLPGRDLEFTMNLREMSAQEVETLRGRVFTRDAGPIEVSTTLGSAPVWALEISDRGAKGLGGPVRNDLAIPTGQPTDFIDLVLNIGAPRDVHLGAGTYGFGKTISYTTSRLGTVLVWSRTSHEGQLQHRLIGSAFGPSFEHDGKRYTGRHWWGRVPEDEERVEPATGREAQSLAENVFVRHFHGDETGTSILILDPVLGGDDREEDARALVESAVWHLWPKLVEPSAGRARMRISVQLNGVPLEIPDITTHPVLSAFADALTAVRRAQGEGGPEPTHPTEVMAVEMFRPVRLLGHVAVTRFPRVEWEAAARDVVPLDEPVSHVALMRHDAELIVRYSKRPELDSAAVQWCAVFKPVEDTDDAFSLSEPPSHDDWVASSVKDRKQKQIVNVALTRIREHVDEILAAESGVEDAPERTSDASVAELADSLASLMGPVPGSAPRRKKAPDRGSRPTRPRVKIAEYVMEEAHSGRRRVGIRCALDSQDGPRRIAAEARVGVEGGGAETDDDLVHALGWTTERPSADGEAGFSADTPLLEPDGDAWFFADIVDDLVADFDVRVVTEEEQ